jgi:hypothetical protein
MPMPPGKHQTQRCGSVFFSGSVLGTLAISSVGFAAGFA